MKNLLATTAAAATFLVCSSGFAQDNWANKVGSIGIGVDRLVTNGTGISLRLFPAELVGLEVGFGSDIAATRDRNDEADVDIRRSERDIGMHLIGEFRMVTSNQATLSAIAGVGFTTHGRSTMVGNEKTVDGYNDIAFELGLRGEVYLYKFFSIFGRVGLTIDPVGDGQREFFGADSEDVATKTTGMNVDILRGDLLGAFGFTFWIPFSAAR